MKKNLNVIKNIITILIVVIAVCMMIFTIVSVNTFNRTDRALFGYKMFIVRSDSMSATDFSAGDLIITKNVDPKTIAPGDIITFSSQNKDNFGEIITHKVRKLTVDASGEPAFVTYGTMTDVDDTALVTYPYIIGRYQFMIPKLGFFFDFLKTVPGYICCILIPFMILIIMQLINFIRIFREYKREQVESIEQERAQVEAQRRENEAMMKQLMDLKAQLGEGAQAPPAEAVQTVPAEAAQTVPAEAAQTVPAESAAEPIAETVQAEAPAANISKPAAPVPQPAPQAKKQTDEELFREFMAFKAYKAQLEKKSNPEE